MPDMKSQLRDVLASILANAEAEKLLTPHEHTTLVSTVTRLSTPTCSLPCGHDGPHSHEFTPTIAVGRDGIHEKDGALTGGSGRLGLAAPAVKRGRGRPPKAQTQAAQGLQRCASCGRDIPADAMKLHSENCDAASRGYFDKDSFTS